MLFQIQTLEKLICKNSYPLTHSCYSELKPIDALFSDERNEILKKDEEKIRNRAFSPPPPNCYLNAGFLISHSSLPSKFEGRFRPASTYLRRTRRKYTPVSTSTKLTVSGSKTKKNFFSVSILPSL